MYLVYVRFVFISASYYRCRFQIINNNIIITTINI